MTGRETSLTPGRDHGRSGGPGNRHWYDVRVREAVQAVRRADAQHGCRATRRPQAGGRGPRRASPPFTLAAPGLLDGRRAVTSRRRTAELAALHPRIEVDPEGAAVADGPFHSAERGAPGSVVRPSGAVRGSTARTSAFHPFYGDTFAG
ncbi:hypothetical protein [Streptomyces sp. NPDC058268]|uniref:hypothetical protein n=1 Tax=Streptomyces sp. NPDC058268 TaxID=3346413 RepID=UPI0036F023BF